MKLLLDAHAFLWYFTADPRLSKTAANHMADVRNELLLSIASVWEIGIKTSLGKLSLPGQLASVVADQLRQANIRLLEIRLDHVAKVVELPFHHKDPFDRMVAAQCLFEQIPILSADPVFDQYGVQRIW